MRMAAQGGAAVTIFCRERGIRKNQSGNDGLSLNKKNDAERVYPYFQCAF